MKVSYLFQDAGRNIGRRRGTFLLGSTVEAICILLLSSLLVITTNLVLIARSARQRAEVFAFITDEAAADPGPLLARIGSLEGVTSVRFVSKESALAELRADLGTDATLLDALDENPLPASIRAAVQPSATAAEDIAALEHKLLLLPGVTEVWSGRELIAQLNRAVRAILALDIVILVVVALAVVFIVFQTVDTSIASRRTEIAIMELVGATRTAVQIPFVIEGAAQGLVGGAAGFLMLFLMVHVIRAITPALAFPLLSWAGFDILLGGLLGVIGSVLALNRSRAE